MLRFLEHRLGLFSAFRSSMSEKHPPAGIGFLRTIGFAALTVLFLQFLSGIALAMHYVPTTDLAYDSVRAIENRDDVVYGTFIRALHHFGASAFVIFVALHMARVFFSGAYKAPREFTWLSGVALFLIVIGFGFTGYLLPWDQKAYFATKVGTEIAGDVQPAAVGAFLRDALRGGEEVGQPTLTRFYIVHVVLLPIALLGVLGLHFYLIQRHGVAAPGREVGDEGTKGPAYFPHHTAKEALVGAVVALGLFAISYFYRAPLEAMAEPSDTSYVPRPDWYFLSLFELLKIFETNREIGTFWIPIGFVVALMLLPFVDRGRQRHWAKRVLMTTVGIMVCLAIVVLTVMGWLDDPKRKKAAEPPRIDGDRKIIDELTLPIPEGQFYSDLERRGYLLVRRLKCTDCHLHTIGEDNEDKSVPIRVFGTWNEDSKGNSRLSELELETPHDFNDVLDEPPEGMEGFKTVPIQDRLAIGAYLIRFRLDHEAAQEKDK